MTLERGPRSLSLARCDVTGLSGLRHWLRERLAGSDGGDAELVCTELVTNAIDHGGGACAVRIAVDEHDVRIEVDDSDAHAPLTVGTSRVGSCRGRVSTMIDALASWGVVRTPRGKTVWARTRRRGAEHRPMPIGSIRLA